MKFSPGTGREPRRSSLIPLPSRSVEKGKQRMRTGMILFKALSGRDGFTLMELMVVVAIIGALMGVGYSGFTSLQSKENVRASAYELAGYLKEARAEAMEKYARYAVTITGNQYTICREAAGNTNDLCNGVGDTVFRVVDVNQTSSGVISISGTGPAAPATPFPMHLDVKGMPKNPDGTVMSAARTITLTNGRDTSTVSISQLGRITVVGPSN